MHTDKRTVSVLAVILAAGFSCAAQNAVQNYLEELKASEFLSSAVWGFEARTLKGTVIAEYNPMEKKIPASNTKMLTTGAALNLLGVDYRYETRLAYTGTIQDGILDGDLYIVGGGDPTVGAEDRVSVRPDILLARWDSLVASAGISRIKGSVVGDGRWLDGQKMCPSWGYDDIGWNYGTPASGLCWYENAQLITAEPGSAVGAPVRIVSTYPQTPWLKLGNDAVTSPKGKGDDLYYETTDFVRAASLRGRLAIDRGRVTEECSNRFGPLTCACNLYTYLVNHGIAVDSGYSDDATADKSSLTALGSTWSPTLAEIAWQCNHVSDNFYAEAILRTMGKVRTGSSSYDSSLVAEKKVLDKMGVDYRHGVRKVDGSGLSRQNYISPDYFVRFLSAMVRTPAFPAFLESLPQPGQYGTLSNRVSSAGKEAKSRIYAKSGSMNGVRCYGGYVMPEDGNPDNIIVFSIMTNNVTAPSSSVLGVCDRLMLLLTQMN